MYVLPEMYVSRNVKHISLRQMVSQKEPEIGLGTRKTILEILHFESLSWNQSNLERSGNHGFGMFWHHFLPGNI